MICFMALEQIDMKIMMLCQSHSAWNFFYGVRANWYKYHDAVSESFSMNFFMALEQIDTKIMMLCQSHSFFVQEK